MPPFIAQSLPERASIVPLPDASVDFVTSDRFCSVRIAGDHHDRERSYRLMYEVYSAQGYGKPHPSEMWFSLHELLPSSITILVMHADEAVGTVTLCVDSTIGVPADDVFGEVLDEQRSAGERIAEVFSLGIREDFRGSEIVLGKLISTIYLIARHLAGATLLAITVVPSHAAFYRRKLLFEQVGEPGFHKKTGVPCVLMVHPLDTFDHTDSEIQARTMNRYYVPRERELAVSAQLQGTVQPISAREIDYFLSIRPEIYENANDEQRAFLDFLQQGEAE